MSLSGHFRQIDPLPTLSACPLRSDRVRTFAPQRNRRGVPEADLVPIESMVTVLAGIASNGR